MNTGKNKSFDLGGAGLNPQSSASSASSSNSGGGGMMDMPSDADRASMEAAMDAAESPGPRQNSGPGKFDDMSRESRQILFTPELFDGIRLEYNKNASHGLTLQHAAGLAGAQPDNYMFTINYAHPKMIAFGRLYQDYGLQYGLFPTILEQFGVKVGINGTVSAKGSQMPTGAGLELDYVRNRMHATLKLESRGDVSVSYNQAVGQRLTLGTGINYTRPRLIAETRFAARYDAGGWVGTLTAGNAYLDGRSLALAYTHRTTKRVSFATEYSAMFDGPGTQPTPLGFVTKWAAGMQFALTMSMLKASIDNDGRIQGYMEHQLSESTRLMGAIELDHSTGAHRFGLGLNMIV